MLLQRLQALLAPKPASSPAPRPYERVALPMMPDDELMHDEANWPREIPGAAPLDAVLAEAERPAYTLRLDVQQCGARAAGYGHHDHVVMMNHGMGQQIQRCCHCGRERILLIPTADAMEQWRRAHPCGSHAPLSLGVSF